MSIGKHIFELRTKKRLSQEKLAQILGVSRQTVSKWESDLSLPNMEIMLRMADYFGVPVTMILGIEESTSESDISKLYNQITHITNCLETQNKRSKNKDRILFCLIGILVLAVAVLSIIIIVNKNSIIIPISQPYVEENNSLFESYEVKQGLLDLSKETVSFDIHVKLKQYSDADKVDVLVDNQIYPLTSNNYGLYSTKIVLPLKDSIQMSIKATCQGISETIQYKSDMCLTHAIKDTMSLYFENTKQDYGSSVERDYLVFKCKDRYSNQQDYYRGTLSGQFSIEMWYKDNWNNKLGKPILKKTFDANKDQIIKLDEEAKLNKEIITFITYEDLSHNKVLIDTPVIKLQKQYGLIQDIDIIH